MVSQSHSAAEEAYVRSLIESADARHAAAIDSLQIDVDRLRDSWAQSYSEQRRASEERIAAIREETARYLQSIANGDPHADVAAGALGDGSGASPDHGHGPRPQPDPYASELQRAQELKDMDMATYARLRADLGVQSPTDLNRLGG